MNGNIKFIRRNGRVIPIHVDTRQGVKGNLTGNRGSLQKEALAEARDAYHTTFDGAQKAAHQKIFGVVKNLLATGGAVVSAKAAFDMADQGINAYHDKAAAAKRKYGTIALGGTVGTSVGLGALAAAARGVGIRAAMRSKLGMASAAATAIGAGAAGVGFYGVHKANKHLERVRALRTGTEAVKKFAAAAHSGTFGPISINTK